MTHNRLVTGSSPVGATKFKLLNQYIKPTFELAFLYLRSVSLHFLGQIAIHVLKILYLKLC